ncbi:MAG: hypothetical protein L3J54_06390 [Draconibacterium sp.]|nr:hypothetical protein [Draconibacterium sp.]
MEEFSKICFVCKKEVSVGNSQLNTEVNLPVCNSCNGTEKEKMTADEYLDDLAEDLICGCI